MKYISRGWQYTVFDSGNGRVFKRYNNVLESFFVMIISSINNRRLPQISFVGNYLAGKRCALNSLKIIQQTSLDKKYFGNPKIAEDGLSYEQDICIPLTEYFKNNTLEDSKNKINDMALFGKFLFEHSIIDKYFNMANNFGVDREGGIVLLDLGEIVTEKEEIKRMVERKEWSTQNVLNKFPTNLRTHYVEAMDKAFLS